MTSRADAVDRTHGGDAEGASGQDIALCLYRAVMPVSVALILLHLA
jgi:hypothetical protein